MCAAKGTPTAALLFAGMTTSVTATNTGATESYNGTSWTEVARFKSSKIFKGEAELEFKLHALAVLVGAPAGPTQS